MAEIVESQSTVLLFGNQAVPQVFEIGPLGANKATRDVTTLSDTIHKYKAGIPDFTDLEVKCYYDPQDPVHQAITNSFINPAETTWSVNLEEGNSPNETNTFNAILTSCQIESFGVDSDLVLSFSIKPVTLPNSMFQP